MNIFKLFLIISVLSYLVIFFYRYLPKNVSTLGIINKEKSVGKLDKGIEEVLKNTKGTYSVVIKNLKTTQVYSLDKDKVFLLLVYINYG